MHCLCKQLYLCVLLLCVLQAVDAKRVQVFGFAVAETPTYLGYDWSVLTTSSWRTDPALIELAQQHGAKVELFAGDVSKLMGDPDKRKAWVICYARAELTSVGLA